MSQTTQHYDIIIVGGGMVGAACALAAAQQGYQCALLEQRPPVTTWSSSSFSARVSALTRTSEILLKALNTWPLITRKTAYQDLHVWEKPDSSDIHFQASDIGEPDLGHIVENRCLIKALWQQLEQQTKLDIHFGTEIIALHNTDQRSTLTCANNSTLTADLLIGADGARSQLRDLAQISIDTHDYQQTALVTLVRAESSPTPTAWQHFLPEGPLALLPVGPDHYAVVWSNTPERTTELLNYSTAAFNQAISQAGHPYSGTLEQVGKRYSFPLRSQTAQAYIKPGIALIGDAAHVIHPLAGQGVNLGLLDVRVLIDTLVEARTQREPLGRFGVLRRYERARKGHNQIMQHSMDVFHYAFTHTHPGIRWMRNVGLGLVKNSPLLRRQCERMALGHR